MTYTCERCQKEIDVENDYEEISTHLFHTNCYIEGLVGAIVTAPSIDQLKQMKDMSDVIKGVAKYFGVPDIMNQLPDVTVPKDGLPIADPKALRAFSDFANEQEFRKALAENDKLFNDALDAKKKHKSAK